MNRDQAKHSKAKPDQTEAGTETGNGERGPLVLLLGTKGYPGNIVRSQPIVVLGRGMAGWLGVIRPGIFDPCASKKFSVVFSVSPSMAGAKRRMV
jgi:hypothetical protein